ncbi:MAG TPA: hypothetical protein VN688_01110 [Gemmataceae bacterium]|nr:hypothetical protein [Gemmataceae bacterium]
MKVETDPITDDEWLLRRVPVNRFRTDEVPIISPNAFEPRIKGRDPDTDGISLYRAACLADPCEVLATIAPERQHECGIVRIAVSSLRSLQLSVKSKPDDRIKGHVVIPELNSVDYASDKSRFTPIKERLAVMASADENIVKQPQRDRTS